MIRFILCLAVATLLLLALIREQRRSTRLTLKLKDLSDTHQNAIRLLRLTAGDLRAPALVLLGHAERAPPPLDAALAGTARGLLDLAEAVLDRTEAPDAPRHLVEENVQLGPLLDFVVAQMIAQLGPGQRAWRIAPAIADTWLFADRRALHQILLRVVTSAALATKDRDWIEISVCRTADGWTLVVEDEGTGSAVIKTAGSGPETRGLGVGLSLARQLMTAHDGTLVVESTAGVGTRTMLMFPTARLVAMPERSRVFSAATLA